jgi:hypothetical protein
VKKVTSEKSIQFFSASFHDYVDPLLFFEPCNYNSEPKRKAEKFTLLHDPFEG